MEPGDITTYTNHFGRRHVAIVLERLADGRYTIFCPSPSHLAVEASPDAGARGMLFDPTLPAPATDRGDVQNEPAEPVQGE